MQNRELLFKNIDEKEREWDNQVKHLQLRAASFDIETRMKIEGRISHINSKLRRIETLTNEVKKISIGTWNYLGHNFMQAWEELVSNIDNAFLRLKI